jgi:hypothetical protein
MLDSDSDPRLMLVVYAAATVDADRAAAETFDMHLFAHESCTRESSPRKSPHHESPLTTKVIDLKALSE